MSMSKFVVVFLLFSVVSASAAAATDELLARWVQMAPGGLAEARAVVRGASCPQAEINGAKIPMRVRAAPDGAFPVLVCALTLNSNAEHASVMGKDIPLPKSAPARIVVLGDTGCRIKGATIQACSDPVAWPFLRIAAQAAKLKPDLVIHVGDYLYRETACPKDNPRCAGSPSGDNWATWAADFFTPAGPLLEAAPWVIVRGNHEDCARAGSGFLRLIGPLEFVEGAACTENIAPYAVPLGADNLIVMDNATAVDRDTSDMLVRTYRAGFAALPRLGSRPAWLVMHHPIWGVASFDFGIVEGGNSTLMEAEEATGMPPNVELMLAGHIHRFEAINYARGLPPQLIVGEGGDLLDNAPSDLSGQTVGTAKIDNGFSLPGYGFVLLTRAGRQWTIDVFDTKGDRERRCSFAAQRIACPKS